MAKKKTWYTSQELKKWIFSELEMADEPKDPWFQLRHKLEQGWDVQISQAKDCLATVKFVRTGK